MGERGVPAAGRLVASNKNGENKMRGGAAVKETKERHKNSKRPTGRRDTKNAGTKETNSTHRRGSPRGQTVPFPQRPEFKHRAQQPQRDASFPRTRPGCDRRRAGRRQVRAGWKALANGSGRLLDGEIPST